MEWQNPFCPLELLRLILSYLASHHLDATLPLCIQILTFQYHPFLKSRPKTDTIYSNLLNILETCYDVSYFFGMTLLPLEYFSLFILRPSLSMFPPWSLLWLPYVESFLPLNCICLLPYSMAITCLWLCLHEVKLTDWRNPALFNLCIPSSQFQAKYLLSV